MSRTSGPQGREEPARRPAADAADGGAVGWRGSSDPGEAHSGDAPRGEEESLYWLALGPGIWALHFLACYLTGAVWCAKMGRDASLATVRGWVVAYTVVALLGLAGTAWHGWRRHSLGAATVPHDFDTPQDRHRFLGFSTLLLAVLSAVAVGFQAAVALFFRSCV